MVKIYNIMVQEDGTRIYQLGIERDIRPQFFGPLYESREEAEKVLSILQCEAKAERGM